MMHTTRLLVVSGLTLWVGLSTGCRARQEDEPLARWHFLGTAQLAGNTNAARLRAVCAVPSTQRAWEHALQRMAGGASVLFGADPAATNAPWRGLVRPLLDDLVTGESYGDWRPGRDQQTTWTFAARVETGHAGLWQTNWTALVAALGAGHPTELRGDGFVGWEAARATPPRLFRYARAGQWTVVSWGEAPLAEHSEFLRRIKATGRPGAATPEPWLEAQADLERLAKRWHWPASVRWPRATLHVTGRGPNLRSSLRLNYGEPLAFKPEPWQMPTNTVREPLTSFTAAQGLRGWLTQQPLLRQAELAPAPNQLFAWALGQVPFQTYVAGVFPNNSNALRHLASRLPGLVKTNLPNLAMGAFVWRTNTSEVSWVGFPVLAPFLRPAPAPESQFLLGGVFPLANTNRPPAPAELYAQVLGHPGLVYYDWEITQDRVFDWKSLMLAYSMASGYAPPPTNNPALLWLSDTNVTRHLGNAATEITYVSPRELQGVRNSSIGLTGVELVALARWLDNPAFPGYRAPTRIRAVTKHPGGLPGPPAPPAAPKP